jgi:hypothetical protein
MKHAAPNKQPSNFKRTINCPSWVVFFDPDAPEEHTEASMDGTISHAIGELCLTENRSPFEFVGCIGYYDKQKGLGGVTEKKGPSMSISTDRFYRKPIDDYIAQNVAFYVDTVREKFSELSSPEIKYEEKLDMGWVHPGVFGTADAGAKEYFGKAVILDLKFGIWPVEIGEKVGDNPQLCGYGIGSIGENNPFNVETVEIGIIQPRVSHPDGRARFLELEVRDLMQWKDEVLKIAINSSELALKLGKDKAPEESFKAGDWCKFCPGEKLFDDSGIPVCPALRKNLQAAGDDMFEIEIVPTLPDVRMLPGERFGKMLSVLEDVIEPWIKTFKEEADRRLLDNTEDKPAGWKMVEGRGSNRKFAVSDSIVHSQLKKWLPKEKIFDTKLATPTNIVARLQAVGKTKKEAEGIIENILEERKSGKPKRVKETDKNPEFNTAESMFGDLLEKD